MAIVQISRIQHRRGRVLEGTGMPILASGELGWAIDTQELYIGSGSVSEGAPAVGNIKLVTHADNLIDFAVGYSYKPGAIQTGETLADPVNRTIQSRLDERVTLAAFGATGVSDGSTDDAIVIQRALDQLYLINNADVSSRVEIHFPAGEYLIKSTIYVPPYATIIGAGKGKTILRSDNVTVFKTTNSTSEPGDYAIDFSGTSDEQPIDITITGLTIDLSENSTAVPAVILAACSDSLFQDISIIGNWQPGDPESDKIGISITTVNALLSKYNRFVNIDISGFSDAIRSDDDTSHNTFSNNTFTTCKYGVVFGKTLGTGGPGNVTGPSYNTIQACIFDEIDQHAIWVQRGAYNASRGNRFLGVGNDAGAPSLTPVTSVIKFPELINFGDGPTTLTNISEGDFFKRSMQLSSDSGVTALLTVPYPPEVEGNVTFSNLYKNSTTIGFSNNGGFKNLLKLPVIRSGKITIDYIYTDANTDNIIRFVREGKIDIICSKDTDTFAIDDNYTWLGDSAYSTLLEFDVKNEPRNGIDTLILQAMNNIPDLTNDKFMYTIHIKS